LKCKTKAIRTGIGVRRSGVSDLGPDAAPLSPGLSCETNPISVGAKSKLSRLQEKSCVVFSRLIGSKKQSQFPALPPGGSSLALRPSGLPGGGCTNKPNFALMPIRRSACPGGPIVRNKANLNRDQQTDTRYPTPGPALLRQTKPISCRAMGGASAL
jgi:hypothetical protein